MLDVVLRPSVLEAMRVTPVTPLRQGSVKPRPPFKKSSAETWTAPTAVARGQLIDLVV